MVAPPLHIVISENDTTMSDLLFASAGIHKIKTNIQSFKNGLPLINYINNNSSVIPDLFLLNLHSPLQNEIRYVKAIRSQRIMDRALLVIYSPKATEAEIEEAFVERANIFIHSSKDQDGLNIELEEILKLAFQYKHSNLSVDNLLLRL